MLFHMSVLPYQNQYYLSSPNNLLWSSLLRKKGWPRYDLAASLEFIRHVSTLRLPWIHFGHASKPCPSCVHLVSNPLWPCILPCVRFVHTSKSCLPYTCLAFYSPYFLSTLCPPMCPPKYSHRSRIGHPHDSELCRSWSAMEKGCNITKYFFCAIHSVYLVYPLINFLSIYLIFQMQPLQAYYMLEKLFEVYIDIILLLDKWY